MKRVRFAWLSRARFEGVRVEGYGGEAAGGIRTGVEGIWPRTPIGGSPGVAGSGTTVVVVGVVVGVVVVVVDAAPGAGSGAAWMLPGAALLRAGAAALVA